ncbi:MAG: DUF1015 family protein [Candidatus Omnitrophica bacterium]|nr:DUF1015 family protein [Candidatus Omnitrophota bacterium]
MSSLIKPFAATHYNTDKLEDISSVICPPYDVINSRQAATLKRQSPFNFCRILLSAKSDYRQAKARFDGWLRKGVLVDDSEENFYLCEQKFTWEKQTRVRYGVLTLLRLDKRGTVFPHEFTHKAPKEDRMRILNELKANLSPIFVVAPSRLSAFDECCKKYSRRRPFLEFADPEGNPNRVWKISDKDDQQALSGEAETAKLVIADGHHRFEVASEYYQRQKGRYKNLNYILAYLTDIHQGLLMLPTHRVAKVVQKEFFPRLEEFFDIRQVSRSEMRRRLETESSGFALGIYRGEKFYFLRLKNEDVLDTICETGAQKRLDTYVLHKLVLPRVMKPGRIEYTHSISEACQKTTPRKAAFLVRATPIKVVFDITDEGGRLPQKSTYFYPKVMSGVVVRRLRGAEKNSLKK